MGIAINNLGHILIRARKAASRVSISFLVSGGDVKELPPARLGADTRYTGINDRGWLAGFVELTERGVRRGFVARRFR